MTLNGGDLTGSKNIQGSNGSGQYSVAGGAANGVNFLLDGGDNNDAFSNVNLPIPFPDAVQEFNVQTSGLPAQYGLHPGGVVNIVTKSGSNAFHGDFVRVLPQRRSERAAKGVTGLATGARLAEAQPVRRHRRRPDHQGQAVLLRRLPGHPAAQRSGPDHRLRPHRGGAEGRLQRAGWRQIQRRLPLCGQNPEGCQRQRRTPATRFPFPRSIRRD